MKTYRIIQMLAGGILAFFWLIVIMGLADGNMSDLNENILFIFVFLTIIFSISSILMAMIFPDKSFKNQKEVEGLKEAYLSSRRKLDKAAKLLSTNIDERIVDEICVKIMNEKNQ